MAVEDTEETNFATFRECLFEAVVSKCSDRSKSSGKRSAKAKDALTSTSQRRLDGDRLESLEKESDPAELAEFSDYIAGEVFPGLPEELRSLSHQALQADNELGEKWSLPLSLSVFEELADMVDPSVADSLVAYGLVEPPKSDVQSFLSPVVTAFVNSVNVPPPKWISTRATACEICDRDWVPMTYHHLIPREIHAKVLKRGWHEEHMLNSVAWLCRACHTFVHKMAPNEELAREWFTVEKICSRDDVQKWARWVGRVRWKKT